MGAIDFKATQLHLDTLSPDVPVLLSAVRLVVNSRSTATSANRVQSLRSLIIAQVEETDTREREMAASTVGILASRVPVEAGEGSETELELGGVQVGLNTTVVLDEQVLTTGQVVANVGDGDALLPINTVSDSLLTLTEDQQDLVDVTGLAVLQRKQVSESGSSRNSDIDLSLVDTIDTIIGQGETEEQTGSGIEGMDTTISETSIIMLDGVIRVGSLISVAGLHGKVPLGNYGVIGEDQEGLHRVDLVLVVIQVGNIGRTHPVLEGLADQRSTSTAESQNTVIGDVSGHAIIIIEVLPANIISNRLDSVEIDIINAISAADQFTAAWVTAARLELGRAGGTTIISAVTRIATTESKGR